MSYNLYPYTLSPCEYNIANIIIVLTTDSPAVVSGTFVIEYHLLSGVDVPNKPLFRFPEQEFTHSTIIVQHTRRGNLRLAAYNSFS